MSKKSKAPLSILDQILDDMFKQLDEEEDFNKITVKKMRVLAEKNSLTDVNKVLEILKELGDAGEDP